MEDDLVEIVWCDNNSRRYDGKRAFVSCGAITRVNRIQITETLVSRSQLKGGDYLDMVFTYKRGEVRVWHGRVTPVPDAGPTTTAAAAAATASSSVEGRKLQEDSSDDDDSLPSVGECIYRT